MRIVQGDLGDARVIELLRLHVERARAETGPRSAHALDLDDLRSPEISFWAAWDDDTLLGVGAVKRLSADHGEVKSMHTAKVARRRGVGRAMLDRLIDDARAKGLSRLSLETGSWNYFGPARALYESHGFKICPPFADYVANPDSVFMSLDLKSPLRDEPPS